MSVTSGNGLSRHNLLTSVVALFSLPILASTSSLGADQSVLGAGNQAAQQLAARSPLVSSAVALITQRIAEISDPTLRSATLDGVTNPLTCVAHRVGMNETTKAEILQALLAEGLIDPVDEPTIPGGLKVGVFPPLPDETGPCPHLPQPFASAPGSFFGGHHSYPGGLAVHEAFNLSSDLSFADNYRKIYGGTSANGLAEIAAAPPAPDKAAIPIDHHHRRASVARLGKADGFPVNEDGTEFTELNFGGNGKTDN